MNVDAPFLILVALAVLAGAFWVLSRRARPPSPDESAGHRDEVFQPRMPEVRPLTREELDQVFRRAFSEPSPSGVIIVTPERLLIQLPTRSTPKLPFPAEELSSELFGDAKGLRIVVISYTDTAALRADRSHAKCIPFLGLLHALGFAGHRVVIFEGEASALSSALKAYLLPGKGRQKGQPIAADFVIVDDGMTPFLASDWESLVFGALKPKGRLLVHRRSDYRLVEVQRPSDQAPEGVSGPVPPYVDGLLTVLGRRPVTTVTLTTSDPLPKLTELTDDPDLLAYVSRLPAHDERWGTEAIIGLLLGLARYPTPDDPSIKTVLRAKLAGPTAELSEVSFSVQVTRAGETRRLSIERLDDG